MSPKKTAAKPKPKAKAKKEVEKDDGPKEKTLGPFDFINDLMYGKKDLIRNSDNPELAEKGFSPFLTNRAMSFHIDTVLYANEMNRRGFLDPLLQHDYYLRSIRASKRGYFWPKKSTDENLQLVQDKYQVNAQRAREMLRILPEEELDRIKKTVNKGGITK